MTYKSGRLGLGCGTLFLQGGTARYAENESIPGPVDRAGARGAHRKGAAVYVTVSRCHPGQDRAAGRRGARATTSSPRASIRPARSSASGASASAPNASRGWRSSPAAGARPAFPPSVVVDVKALACELPGALRRAAVALVAGGDAAGSDGPGARRADQRDHPLALAQPGCDPALAPPQLDLPARPRTSPPRRAGSWISMTGAGRAGLWGHGSTSSRADEKTSIQARRRCHPTLPAAPGSADARRARVRAGRRLGLSRRLGCPSGQGLRPLRSARPASRPSTAWSPRSCPKSPTARRTGCSGSWTTGPRIAASPPLRACRPGGPS